MSSTEILAFLVSRPEYRNLVFSAPQRSDCMEDNDGNEGFVWLTAVEDLLTGAKGILEVHVWGSDLGYIGSVVWQ